MAKYRLAYCFYHVIDGTTRFSFLKISSKKRDIAPFKMILILQDLYLNVGGVTVSF